MDIWLIRHTTPDIDKGICYGQLDLNIIDSFKKEADAIKTHLAAIDFKQVFASPLVRCKKLAEELFPEHEITYSNLLKEIDFGDWEGKPWEAIPRNEMNQWSDDYINNQVPNGESFRQLLERTNAFIDGLNTDSDDTIALVTHSGIIRAFLIRYLQIPETKVFSLDLSFGCIVKATIHSEKYQKVKFIKA
ncbi:alpha-ribazole phosphatase [Carboxylicivirga sp. RSCT41]|uniref:alpha-ribazole phosphatase n=1 Tax=Carboxylicivirga agarovorans TaxID=3417570 RepID=UPI003D33920E